MVELLAYAPEDGWAFVQDGASIFLVRPPYDGNRLAVRMADVERAVTVSGYLALERSFGTEREVVDFLRAEFIRSWPVTETPEQLCEDLLQLATPDEIDVYLDEADDWKKQGRHDAALALLRQLYRAKAITFEQRLRLATSLDEQSLREHHREEQNRIVHAEILRAKFTRTASVRGVFPPFLQPSG